jgi:ATP-dependent RNA helicase SUPV3L1/SUV3
LAPLIAMREDIDARAGTPDALPASARGIAFQLCENLGTLDIAKVSIEGDPRPVSRALKPYGVKFGHRSIYMPQLLRPDAASLLALLRGIALKLDKLPAAPQPGLTSFAVDNRVNSEMLHAAGFRVIAHRAIRVDMLERLEDELEKGVGEAVTADAMIPRLVSLLGCDRTTLEAVLVQLGWRIVEVAGTPATTAWRHKSARHSQPKRGSKSKPQRRGLVVDPNSPFAGLARLKMGRR